MLTPRVELRHRRPGADDIGSSRRNYCHSAARAELDSVFTYRANLHIHDYPKHSRTPGRYQDRFLLHSGDYFVVVYFTRVANDRAAR